MFFFVLMCFLNIYCYYYMNTCPRIYIYIYWAKEIKVWWSHCVKKLKKNLAGWGKEIWKPKIVSKVPQLFFIYIKLSSKIIVKFFELFKVVIFIFIFTSNFHIQKYKHFLDHQLDIIEEHKLGNFGVVLNF